MGGEDSKPKEEDCFILEHLSKMSLKSKKGISYYFIQPHRDADLDSTLKHLRQYFKLDYFPEIKTLKQEMSFVHKNQIVKVIFTKDLPQEDLDYLQGEQKISQLVLFGDGTPISKKYSKVVGEAKQANKLIELLNELEEKDALQIPSSNLLLLIDQDTKMLNKYRLNYHCNTQFIGREQAKLDFVELARKLFPEQQDAITDFEKNYDLTLEGEDRQKMVVQWLIKNNFYWQLVHTLTRTTSDPKRLAYIRLGLKDIYEAIFNLFKKQLYFKEMYVVIDITEQEKIKLQKSANNFLLFTSFVRGFLDQGVAKKQLKSRGANAIMFIVIPFRKQTLQPSLDFGYLVFPEQKSVIFNIYNVFRVGGINVKAKWGELQYGALPEIFTKRKIEDERTHMSKLELDLMRNYDYLEDMLSKVDSQATLLQLAGYYDDALKVYDQRVDYIRDSVHDQDETMNRCLIRKGDALRISGDYNTAQKEYQATSNKSEKFKLISKIHLAELYMLKGQEDKFEVIIDQIAPHLNILEKVEKEEYLKGRNFVVIRTIKKGGLKKAEKMLEDLQKQVGILYDYTMEGKPLVHDIYRSLATCKSRLGRHEDALGLLKHTLQWQLVCEGKTPNVALTETLIQSVSRSSGNNGQLQKSLARLSAMSQQIESSQRRFESSVMVGLNQSLIKMSLP